MAKTRFTQKDLENNNNNERHNNNNGEEFLSKKNWI